VPAVALLLLPFRVATQRLHLEVGLVLHDAPRQRLAACRPTFILKNKRFSVTNCCRKTLNFSWTTYSSNLTDVGFLCCWLSAQLAGRWRPHLLCGDHSSWLQLRYGQALQKQVAQEWMSFQNSETTTCL
jgi:hypothetical protein